MTIIPMKRRFLITPLKMFFSSGFRALNSLNACQNQNKNQINIRACLHAQGFSFQFTYLADNKGVENYCVLHSGGMCRNFMLEAKYAYASEIEN